MATSRIPTTLLAAVTLIASCAVFVWPAVANSGAQKPSLSIQDHFNSENLNAWEMPFAEDWEILTDGSLHYLHMKRSRPPGVPRRPLQFARLKGVKAGSFTFSVKVRICRWLDDSRFQLLDSFASTMRPS